MSPPPRCRRPPGAMAATALGAAILMTPSLLGQSLEPRSYANTPVGMNFAITGYSHTKGDVIPGPSLPLKDAKISMQGPFLAYARALNLWGDSGKVDAVLPYNWASGSATFAGQPHDRQVNGPGDPALRFTWNFVGAPALTLPEFLKHESDWIVGASVRFGLPLGQYDNEKLLNIGANRWSFKPELGVSKTLGRWILEAETGVTFFTDNDQFLGEQTRAQDPILALQVHAIYTLPNGIWAGLDGTFYGGGTSSVDGISNDDRQSNSRFGLTLALPLGLHQSIKLFGSIGASARAGGDFTTVGIAWQYRWGGGLPSSPPGK